jgi:hypothetical protein
MGIDLMMLGNGLPSRLFPVRRLVDNLPSELNPMSRFRWYCYAEGNRDLEKYVSDLKSWLATYDRTYEFEEGLGDLVAQFIQEASAYIAVGGTAYVDL